MAEVLMDMNLGIYPREKEKWAKKSKSKLIVFSLERLTWTLMAMDLSRKTSRVRRRGITVCIKRRIKKEIMSSHRLLR
jgi:hypothetical protein